MMFQSKTADKIAISLSSLCMFHCLATPIFVSLLPSLSALPLERELFHLWMVLAVIPISIYALTLGCRKHASYAVAGFGLLGLCILISAVIFGESHLGEFYEKLLTVIGACSIGYAHLLNFKLCQDGKDCACPDNKQ